VLTLKPGEEAEQDDAWPGDQGVVVQCVVDGQVSVQANEAQGQHANDDEAVVGPAHNRTQQMAQRPSARTGSKTLHAI
jgi:hypothetical protein